jgi:eukaryotic-like serine/threonine-protein kinase
MARSRPGAPPVTSRSAEGPGLLADPRDEDEDSSAALPASHRPAPEPLPEEERPFGRYTLLRRLAYGGMGEVFLARQGGAGSLATVAKLVVIKRILAHMKRDEKHRQMFLGEARLQALLNSPHIVAIHDMGEEKGHVYLAMEHVHGPSWRLVVDRCRRRKEFIPLAHVCTMVAQAARGLSYAHNLVDVTGHPLKIVHRDINPHNILVTYDGQVKIIDFGIAKSELHEGHTETGTIKGKFNYMSPEQSAAEPLDARSDLFALGICLYELATNINPFRRGNAVLSLEAIQKDAPPPLARRRPEATPLQHIIDKCLAKERDDRYSDAAEIAADLDELLSDGVVSPPSEPLPTWLRERFADEIAEHVQILEQTGSQGAAVVRRGSDPSQMPRVPRTNNGGSRPDARPVRSEVSGPVHPPVEPYDDLPENTLAAPNEQTSTTPPPSEQPRLAPTRERTSSGNTARPAARVSAEVPAPLPERQGGVALGAVIGVLLLAAIGLAVFVTYKVVIEKVGRDEVIVIQPNVEPKVEPKVEPAKVPVKQEPVVVEAKPDEPKVDEPVIEEPQLDDVKTPTNKKKKVVEKEKPPVAPKELFATVGVKTDGYLVRGNRKLGKGETVTLSIGGDDAPFSVKLRVEQVGDGAKVSVSSDPWALLIVGGVGKGKTPQSFTIAKGASSTLKLSNPKATGPMEIGLSLQ